MTKLTKIAIIIGSLFLIITLIFPFVLNGLYNVLPRTDILTLNGRFEPSSILSYYGSVLGMISTAVLSIIAIYQTKKAQEKSDEVNKLTLELQKKSMALAEKQYKEEENRKNDKPQPKFQISTTGMGGSYSGIFLVVTNVSKVIVSSLSTISFVAQDESGKQIGSASSAKFITYNLGPQQKSEVRTDMTALPQNISNAKLIWEFSCEDEDSVKCYFRATQEIPNTRKSNISSWKVERVG